MLTLLGKSLIIITENDHWYVSTDQYSFVQSKTYLKSVFGHKTHRFLHPGNSCVSESPNYRHQGVEIPHGVKFLRSKGQKFKRFAGKNPNVRVVKAATHDSQAFQQNQQSVFKWRSSVLHSRLIISLHARCFAWDGNSAICTQANSGMSISILVCVSLCNIIQVGIQDV